MSLKLSEEFLNKYKDVEPPMTNLGNFVYYLYIIHKFYYTSRKIKSLIFKLYIDFIDLKKPIFILSHYTIFYLIFLFLKNSSFLICTQI